MIPGSEHINKLATEYSKPQLQQLAQTGQISPMDAIMAAMMIDRITMSGAQPPHETVAQEVLGAPSMQGVPGNMAYEAPGGAREEIARRMHQQYAQQPRQSMAEISAAHGGLMSIPRPGEKYNVGGAVAFADGGSPYISKEQRRMEEKMRRQQKPTPPIHRFSPEQIQALQEWGRAQNAAAQPVSMADLIPSDAVSQAPSLVPASLAAQQAAETIGKKETPLAAMAQGKPQQFSEQALTQQPPAAQAQTESLESLRARLYGNAPDRFGALEKQIAESQGKGADLAGIKNMALLQAGARMMAGTSPFGLVNVGEGLMAGANSYAQQLKEQKSLNKEDRKDLLRIAEMQEQIRQGEIANASSIWSRLQTNMTQKEIHEADRAAQMEMTKMRVASQDRATAAGGRPFNIAEAYFRGTPEDQAKIQAFYEMQSGAKVTDESTRQRILAGLKDTDYFYLLSTGKPKDKNKADAMFNAVMAQLKKEEEPTIAPNANKLPMSGLNKFD